MMADNDLPARLRILQARLKPRHLRLRQMVDFVVPQVGVDVEKLGERRGGVLPVNALEIETVHLPARAEMRARIGDLRGGFWPQSWLPKTAIKGTARALAS